MRNALFLLLTLSLAAPASASDVRLEDLTRAASLMRALSASCGAAFQVNPEEAEKYFRVFIAAGREAFSKRVFDSALAREYPRRTGEITVTGRRRWCGEQRMILMQDGSEFQGGKLFRD